MNVKKIALSMFFLAIAALLVMLFWKQSLLLIGSILLLAFIKHKTLPIKQELLWFILVGILGSLFENLIIFSGAWSYPQNFFIHIPAWLPFLWGISGTTALPLYFAITGKK